jgi:hypothetical protein
MRYLRKQSRVELSVAEDQTVRNLNAQLVNLVPQQCPKTRTVVCNIAYRSRDVRTHNADSV